MLQQLWKVWQSSRRVVLPFLSVSLMAAACMAADPAKDAVYEMRTYYSPEGKLDALHARFRNHTTKLFEKHGMINIGYFVPVENPDRKLIYWLAYPSKEARDKSWKAFLDDPDWKKAHKESEVNGPLVSKVESQFMKATDYSPAFKAGGDGKGVIELRVYTTTDGNLDRLHARFRNHTTKLFEKHGMTNVLYWSLLPDQKDADKTLVYLLAHKSVDAAKESFNAFRQDPDWGKARTESEKEAGGSLTVKDGVKSTFMKSVDYSPIK